MKKGSTRRPVRRAGKLLRWGNSWGVRLSKHDVEELGLREGQEFVYEVVATPAKTVDLSWLRPVVSDGTLRQTHDEVDWA